MTMMTPKSATVLIMALVFCLSASAHAAFYKYRDANGVLRFTDDLSEVPPEQRPKMETYGQVEDFQRPAPQTPIKAPDEKAAEAEKGSDGSRAAEIADQYKELNEMKTQLDAEYEALMTEKKAIEAERKAAQTKEAQEAVNERVRGLNERIKAFDQKRGDFEQQVKAYNELRLEL